MLAVRCLSFGVSYYALLFLKGLGDVVLLIANRHFASYNVTC